MLPIKSEDLLGLSAAIAASSNNANPLGLPKAAPLRSAPFGSQ